MSWDRGRRGVQGGGAAVTGSIERLADLLSSLSLCPVDLCRSTMAAATSAGISGTFVTVTLKRALREAEASRERLAAGQPISLLDGIPVAWKDLFDLAGEVTTAGSELFRHAPPAEADAPVVASLSQLGAMTVGKTTLSEFAYSGLGINPHFGTPANPWSPTEFRVPGGSSSGNAVAIAAGVIPAAIGTDTSGSVRVPAAFNGIVGFKPSPGRYPQGGVFALSRTLDEVGPMAATVQDCVLLDQALRGVAPVPINAGTLQGVRLVVPTNVMFEDIDDGVAANFEHMLRTLAGHGARIERVALKALQQAHDAIATHGTITAAEAYALHRKHLDGQQAGLIDPHVFARLIDGERITPRELSILHKVRDQSTRLLADEVDGALLLYPTVVCTAPLKKPLEQDAGLFQAINGKVLRNTMTGSYLGLPSIALPNDLDAVGLPTSGMLSAVWGDDIRLLKVALAIESVLVSEGLWALVRLKNDNIGEEK